MSLKDKDPPKNAVEEIIIDDNALPPLDHDEIKETDPEELADLLDPKNEKESFLTEEGEESTGDEGVFAESLMDLDDDSWAEGEGEQRDAEVSVDIDDKDEGWSEKGAGGSFEFEGDWFIDDDNQAPVLNDDGAEGPAGEDIYDLDKERDNWDSLGDETDDEDHEESTLEVMDRLGITLPTFAKSELDSNVEVNLGLLVDSLFLGPKEGMVAAATFVQGSPIAVGDGLFVPGADGMLHPVLSAQRLAEMQATSICIHDKTLFIGTQCGGAVATKDRGVGFQTLNSWYTSGLASDSQTLPEQLSTSFGILGQHTEGGFRLFGCTGEGQLFLSMDRGASWRGPLIRGHCLDLSPVAGSSDLTALVDSQDHGIQLLRSRDLKKWDPLSLPDGFTLAVNKSTVCLAASTETMVIAAEDPEVDAYCSLDNGRTWGTIDGLKGVTALALDGEDPGWIAAAVHDESNNGGLLRISQDGGKHFKTVLKTGEVDQDNPSKSVKEVNRDGRILDLILDVGRTHQVIAITQGGIYLVTLTRKGVSH